MAARSECLRKSSPSSPAARSSTGRSRASTWTCCSSSKSAPSMSCTRTMRRWCMTSSTGSSPSQVSETAAKWAALSAGCQMRSQRSPLPVRPLSTQCALFQPGTPSLHPVHPLLTRCALFRPSFASATGTAVAEVRLRAHCDCTVALVQSGSRPTHPGDLIISGGAHEQRAVQQKFATHWRTKHCSGEVCQTLAVRSHFVALLACAAE